MRAALDLSRDELRRLKESVGDFNQESYLDTVERLALENHVLRRKILDGRSESFQATAEEENKISSASALNEGYSIRVIILHSCNII